MDDLVKIINRKINIRKTAIDNLGYDMDMGNPGPRDNTAEIAGNDMKKLHMELYDNIREADQSRVQSFYSVLTSRRRLGKLIVFVKRAIRKTLKVFLGWYITPILDKQSHFNGKAVNSVDLLRKILILQEKDYLQRIKDLECEVVKIKDNDFTDRLNSIKNEMTRLIDKIAYLEDRNAEQNITIDELNEQLDKYKHLEQNLDKYFDKYLENHLNKYLDQHFGKYKYLEGKITELSTSVDELNRMIGKLDSVDDTQKQLSSAANDLSNKMKYVLNRLNVSCDIDLLQQSDIDYFKFENTYRGSRINIKEVQSVYVPYFRHNWGGSILDIGCGRGEFLELMMENGIDAHGVDIYQPFVDYCNERGFSVHKGDALTYLSSLDDCSLGGIFMSQVVEHLSNDYVISLIKTAYKKLKPGCYFILETPNPDCLAAISEFNIDIGHIKPVHYKALEFIFREANYTSVERYHTQQSLYPLSAKHIDGKEINNIQEFNQGIDNINGLLFTYRDYTLIAKK